MLMYFGFYLLNCIKWNIVMKLGVTLEEEKTDLLHSAVGIRVSFETVSNDLP